MKKRQYYVTKEQMKTEKMRQKLLKLEISLALEKCKKKNIEVESTQSSDERLVNSLVSINFWLI